MATTLKSQHFETHIELTQFINLGPNLDPDNPAPIARTDILKIDADSTSGGWVMWYLVTT